MKWNSQHHQHDSGPENPVLGPLSEDDEPSDRHIHRMNQFSSNIPLPLLDSSLLLLRALRPHCPQWHW